MTEMSVQTKTPQENSQEQFPPIVPGSRVLAVLSMALPEDKQQIEFERDGARATVISRLPSGGYSLELADERSSLRFTFNAQGEMTDGKQLDLHPGGLSTHAARQPDQGILCGVLEHMQAKLAARSAN